MTDKLKCPFCGAELVGHEDAYGNISDIWFDCPNEECEHAWTTFRFDIWQALIDGKKAQDELERTRKALKIAVDALKSIDWCGQDYANAQGALDEITTLEQKDNK